MGAEARLPVERENMLLRGEWWAPGGVAVGAGEPLPVGCMAGGMFRTSTRPTLNRVLIRAKSEHESELNLNPNPRWNLIRIRTSEWTFTHHHEGKSCSDHALSAGSQ